MSRIVSTYWVFPNGLIPADAPAMRTAMKHPLRVAVFLAVVMSAAFPLYLMLCSRERVVVHVSDDAYYYFNVAANIAKGLGPTADGITKTTGFHPLYAFLLAGLYRLTNPSLDGFVDLAVAVNAVSYLLAGLLLYMTARRWWGTTAGVVAAIIWLANPHGALVTGTGMEGGLYALTLSLLLWRLVLFVKDNQGAVGVASLIAAVLILGVIGGLVVLSRADALALAPLVVLVMVAAMPRRRWPTRIGLALLFAVIVAALLGLWWWYAWKHTGSIVQGSAAIKVEWKAAENADRSFFATIAALFREWAKYVLKAFVKVPMLKWALSGVPLLFLIRGVRAPRGERWLLHVLWVLPVLLGLAYAMYLDRARTWYYVPGLVMLTLMTAGATAALLETTTPNRLQRLARQCLPLIAWAVIIESAVIFTRDAVFGRSSEQSFAVVASDWLEKSLPPGTRLGCWHSGIVQYYTPNIDVINLDGLANNDILDVLRGKKTMNEYWDEMGIQGVLGKPRAKMGGYQEYWNGKCLQARGPYGKLLWIVPIE